MALGILLDRVDPDLGAALDGGQAAGVSAPVAVGLLWMMYPVLAKVRYTAIGAHARDTNRLGPSLVLNWVVGPLLMLALAGLFPPDLPASRNGLVLVEFARCMAMVLSRRLSVRPETLLHDVPKLERPCTSLLA